MVDLGQALTAQDRRDSASRVPFASQPEREARNRMIDSEEGTPEFIAARATWLQLRTQRLAKGN